MNQTQARELEGPRRLVARCPAAAEPVFSVCTMVTDRAEYADMRADFAAHGFDHETCEFLSIDNSQGNVADAYVAVNEFLQTAQGQYVVLCHSDIVLLDDGRARLEECLRQLEADAPFWAIAGNAGMSRSGWPATCISDPASHENVCGGPFPVEALSLDENFLVVKRAANLAVSRDLAGYHHYGTDLCIMAGILGWSAHVIDFFLHHKSAGTIDDRYYASAGRVERKYARALQSRWVPMLFSAPLLLAGAGTSRRMARVKRLVAKLTGKAPRNRELWSEERRTVGERHVAATERMRR